MVCLGFKESITIIGERQTLLIIKLPVSVSSTSQVLQGQKKIKQFNFYKVLGGDHIL